MYTLKTKCLEATITRGDYEYHFWSDQLEDFDPMQMLIEKRPAHTGARWTELKELDLPKTRFALIGYVKFDMCKSMSFQQFLSWAFPDMGANLE